MEFTIAGDTFGINVAKITEIMQCKPVKPMPNSHPNVEGVFMPRDQVITVIDLPGYMGLPVSADQERDMFMITGFNNIHVAFHVHTVEGIHRIKWSDIEKPDSTIYGGTEGMATGIAKVGRKLITIVDFESIVFTISPELGIQISEITELGPRQRSTKPIITADDSVLLRKLVNEALTTAGYMNIKSFRDGQETWEYLENMRDKALAEDVSITSKVAAVITDIEMPMMDGHRLTKLIKNDKILGKIPVIIFSSLIDEAMRIKGDELGADGQLSKPEIGNLVATLDSCIA
ncbi:MAG: chemotaxis protein [Oscillospiraceae bacterium]|nr:chemotaxis protein [Oscillospiraceae bacterium]